MKLFSWLFKKKQPQEFVRVLVQNTVWRNSMWVMTDYGIGILFDISKGIVHLVGQDGQTTEAVVVNLNGIRQAKWKEIPECRRQITEEEGKALGYGS